jgi:DNA-binding NarL/FixJ family response regulator
MWKRWKVGQSLHEIGRAFGKDHVSIQFMLAQHGGIAPASRRRSLLTLTLAEQENISRGIACGSSIREIAKGLRRAVSTVSREITRHGGQLPVSSNGRRSESLGVGLAAQAVPSGHPYEAARGRCG